MIFVLMAMVVVTSAVGELLITHGMKQAGEIHDFCPRALWQALWRAVRGGWMPAGVVALAVSFFSLLAALSAADASLVIPATAATYVLNTLGAGLFLKERVSGTRWIGAVLVATGVALVSL